MPILGLFWSCLSRARDIIKRTLCITSQSELDGDLTSQIQDAGVILLEEDGLDGLVKFRDAERKGMVIHVQDGIVVSKQRSHIRRSLRLERLCFIEMEDIKNRCVDALIITGERGQAIIVCPQQIKALRSIQAVFIAQIA